MNFSVGIKKENFLSRADARVKLISGLLLLVMVLGSRGFGFPLVMASLSLLLCLWMRVPLRAFMLRFSEPAFIAIMVVALKFLFTGSDEIFSVDLFGLHIAGHRDGLMDGLLIAARIAAAVSIVAMLGFATPFTEFMAALSWLRLPKGLIELLMFAYRYIFLLLKDAAIIYNAQKNRLGYSSVRRGLGSFGVLAGSLTLKAFENSRQTATAMLQRGFEGDMPMLRHKPFRLAEVAFCVLVVFAAGIAWIR